MTSRWDAWTYWWPFQQRSTRSSPRDLNLDLVGGQNSLDQNISILSDSQFWIKWLMWAGAPSYWKTYSLSDASFHLRLHFTRQNVHVHFFSDCFLIFKKWHHPHWTPSTWTLTGHFVLAITGTSSGLWAS